MTSSSTCWLKPDDLKKLLEKNGITVNITDFTIKEEDQPKKEEKKEKKEKAEKKEKKEKKDKKDKKEKEKKEKKENKETKEENKEKNINTKKEK